MDPQLKQRLVGAAVLLSLAVIFLPLILSGPPPGEQPVVRKEIPVPPASDFASRVLPMTPPARPTPSTPTAIPTAPPAAIPDPPEPAEADAAPTASARTGLRAWAIQVGTFSGEENALTMSQELRRKGFDAFVSDQQGRNGKVWLVRVGPELERANADALREKLRGKQGIKDAYVVRYP